MKDRIIKKAKKQIKKKKKVRKMFSSSLAKFEKLNKNLKDCFVCYDMYLTFNDLFHDSEGKNMEPLFH